VVLAPTPLATAARRTFRFHALFRWWHLLSLDAPTVAALWSWSFARAMHIHLPWSAPLLLALGTWLIYIADRILDVLRGGASGTLRERHFFYARHRARTLAVGALASLALLWLIFMRMNPAARREDVVLFAAALVYFCLIHVWAPQSPSGIERWFPKEIAVAVVFAAAVAVPAWSRIQGQRILLTPLVVLFSLLCWLNCVAIEKWEKSEPPSSSHARASSSALPHLSTRWTQRHLPLVACGIAMMAVTAAASSIVSAAPVVMTSLYLACTVSALLFLALDRSRLDSFDLRIAADAVLLTPLLLLAVPR
jgi:hypothetical protein